MNSESVYPVIIETKRLIVQEFRSSDIDDLFVYARRADVTQYVPWGPYSRNEALAQISSYQMLAKITPRQQYHLSIQRRDDGRHIGSLHLEIDSREPHRAEIGYVISPDAWGQGYGREALRALTDWAFARLGLVRLFALTDVRNGASIRILEACGYVREGVLKKEKAVRGQLIDSVQYAAISSNHIRSRA